MKKKVRRNTLVVMTFFSGMILALQIRGYNQVGEFASGKSIVEMKREIAMEKSENRNLAALIASKKSELVLLSEKIKEGNLSQVLTQELETSLFTSGELPAKGPGIKITLRDSQRDLKEGQNPNDLVIHDQDILNILNDLKVSGCEAIGINGERINEFSDIRCNGPTITINQRTYGEPFFITAIGNPDILEGAVLSLDSNGYLLQSTYGIHVEVSKEQELQLAPIRSLRKNYYLKGAES